jgi:tryptophanase
MFGRQPDGREVPARYELVRLAMPRRVYTQSHADYLIEVFAEVVAQAAKMRGMRITNEAPQMRHFTASFARL